MKAIFRLKFDCGRSGDLSGIFVAEKEHVNYLIENRVEIYFGEVLGKHSEVYGPIDSTDELAMVSDIVEHVEMFEGLDLETGHNPFHYTPINFSHDGMAMGDDETIGQILKRIIPVS